jgi:hypothetical protein
MSRRFFSKPTLCESHQHPSERFAADADKENVAAALDVNQRLTQRSPPDPELPACPEDARPRVMPERLCDDL